MKGDISITLSNYNRCKSFYQKNDKLYNQVWDEKNIVIEDEVSIGDNSVILPGVEIPKGTIIGVGSIVTRSPESEYTITGGIPDKFIKNRPE